jgi:maltose O-acetyltransferase
MKKYIANIFMKLILNSSSKYKKLLLTSLITNDFIEKKKLYYHKYNISDSFKFNGNNIQLYGEGIIQLGNNSYIGDSCTIQSYKNCKVIIGDNCAISHNVRMYTMTYDSNQEFNNSNEKKIKTSDVVIGNGVWIGANVFINPGISIGDNSIIGANSVVTKNVKPNAIYGGVPAKFIRFKE